MPLLRNTVYLLHRIGLDDMAAWEPQITLPAFASYHSGRKLDKAWLLPPWADGLLPVEELIEVPTPTS